MAKIKKPKLFTIDRRKWARGPVTHKMLLGSDGTMCCLGFYSRACGFGPPEIRGRFLPTGLAVRVPGFVRYDGAAVRCKKGDIEDLAAACNDNKDIDEPTREAQIIAGFKHFLGVDVKFVGKGFPEA